MRPRVETIGGVRVARVPPGTVERLSPRPIFEDDLVFDERRRTHPGPPRFDPSAYYAKSSSTVALVQELVLRARSHPACPECRYLTRGGAFAVSDSIGRRNRLAKHLAERHPRDRS